MGRRAFIPNGVIAVEAKVSEPFDDLVSVWIFKKGKANPKSPPHRTRQVVRYAEAFGMKPEQLLEIRYQLLQRTLCAALTAKQPRVSRAWMVGQSFPSGDGGEKHLRNREDFSRFVALVGQTPSVRLGLLPHVDAVAVRIAWTSEDGLHSEKR